MLGGETCVDVDEDEIAELVEEVRPLTASEATGATADLNHQGAPTYEAVEFQLGQYFRANPAVGKVNLLLYGRKVGVVTPDSLGRNADKMAGEAPAPQTGVSERGQLPGISTKYRLLVFTCQECPDRKYRIHYDERDIPSCPHGKMELRRGPR